MLPPRTALVAAALCTLSLAALTACSSTSSPSTSGSSGSSGSTSSSSGSSGSASSSNVARPKDMCALLSKAEASTAMKTTIATTYEAEKNACNYSGEDLSFETELSPTEITEFSTEKSLLKLDVGKLSPISGVGDEAAGNNNGITFRVGKVMMYIQSEPGTTRTTQAEMIAAAKVMISHLG